jgi:hypothetical protein
MADMSEWYFQPTEGGHYTKVGGWPKKHVPVIEGVFLPCSPGQRCPDKCIPATEIRWTVIKEGQVERLVMVHMSKWGELLGHFWILNAPAVDIDTAKRITGFKPYKPPAITIFGIPIDFEK